MNIGMAYRGLVLYTKWCDILAELVLVLEPYSISSIIMHDASSRSGLILLCGRGTCAVYNIDNVLLRLHIASGGGGIAEVT